MKSKQSRIEKDNYPTPIEFAQWGMRKAIEIYGGNLRQCKILEPGCGDAPFLQAAMEESENIKGLYGLDIRESSCEIEYPKCKISLGREANFLKPAKEILEWAKIRGGFDLIITNPPYGLAEDFILQSLRLLSPTGVAGFLLKLDFLGSAGRRELFEENPFSELWTSQRRPSFVYGTTDMHNYGFFYWVGEALRRAKERAGVADPRIFWFYQGK